MLLLSVSILDQIIISETAKDKGVDIRLYDIIYKVVEEMEAAMKGMLDPEYEEKVLGQAEIRKIYKFSKTGNIAGCYVLSGIIKSNSKARVIRDGIVIYDGNINSIQREKDSVKEVKSGFECGITLENYGDIKEKDIIEAYELVERLENNTRVPLFTSCCPAWVKYMEEMYPEMVSNLSSIISIAINRVF